MPGLSLFSTAIGTCGIAWRGDRVVATQLPEESGAATLARIAARSGGSEATPTKGIALAIASIQSLLAGNPVDLNDIACDFAGVDSLSEDIYAITRTIGPGETATYGEIAQRLGDKQPARQVGRAMGRNPIPIIVPCHRVMGADNRLVGFSAHGGTDTKLKMLRIKGAQLGESLSLFDDL